MFFEKKTCTQCEKTKPIGQFYKQKGTKDGYQYWCKSCARNYHKTPQGKESQKRYDQSEKGKKKAKRYNWSDKGKEKYVRFRRTSKGQQSRRRDEAIRRTREEQAGGSYTTSEWYNLCKFYDFKCLKCNKKFPFDELTLDHIKPVSKGGTSFVWNIQPLCSRCNRRKGAKEIDYRKTLPDWLNRDGPVWQQGTLL